MLRILIAKALYLKTQPILAVQCFQSLLVELLKAVECQLDCLAREFPLPL